MLAWRHCFAMSWHRMQMAKREREGGRERGRERERERRERKREKEREKRPNENENEEERGNWCEVVVRVGKIIGEPIHVLTEKQHTRLLAAHVWLFSCVTQSKY